VPELPFEGSRRLTGPNLHFADGGAVLETRAPLTEAVRAGWRARVAASCARLGWDPAPLVVRSAPALDVLAFSAPLDALMTATEVNEWALLASLDCHALHAPGHPAAWDETCAMQTLARFAADEAQPALRSVVAEAHARSVPVLLDDDTLTLGLGCHARSWPRRALIDAASLDWSALRGVPTALVTGSNGKTTTVRLMAAMLRESGFVTGLSCTDGIWIDDAVIAAGDYSGPAGARTVLRDARVQAAVLEAARGGILRRGLALQRADVAVVTNVSADHFGEYGIHDLESLAEVKLAVARTLDMHGTLVVNADDTLLARLAPTRAARLAWFAQVDDHPVLQQARRAGGSTCAVSSGRLQLWLAGETHDLGAVPDLPICADGAAAYNLANAAAAALAATALGVAPSHVAAVLARFGRQPQDNPGRLERYAIGGLQLLVDYAHNPEGLRGVLRVAQANRGGGRLGLLLGQAGNREDADIRLLAVAAAAFSPELVVVKGIDGFARGRQDDEVPRLLCTELQALGFAAETLPIRLREIDAAREALAWARPGDTLALLVHSLGAREALYRLLDRLVASRWCAGDALPPIESG